MTSERDLQSLRAANAPLSIEQFTQTVASATEPMVLWDACMDWARSHNICKISYHHLPPPGASGLIQPRFIEEGFPEEFAREYIDERKFEIDPGPAFAKMVSRPFRWSRLSDLHKLTEEQKAFLSDVIAHNPEDGLALEVFGPSGRNGYVGLGFAITPPDPLPEPELRRLQWACQLAHWRYCELRPLSDFGIEALSPREKEILNWVARGKSNADIAIILDISPNTVDTYMRRIFAKYNVTDRTTAAVLGVGAGVIT